MPRMMFAMGFIAIVVGGTNFYIARRLFQCIRGLFPGAPGWLMGLLAVGLTALLISGFFRSMLPLSSGMRNLLGTVSSYWMGIFVYLLIFFVLTDLVLLAGMLFRLIPRALPGNVRFVSGVIALVLTAVTCCYGFVHARNVKRVDYEIVLTEKSLADTTLVLISDLHLGAQGSEQRLEKIVEAVNDAKPDLVCIAGDLFDNDFSAIRDPERAAQLLGSIQAPEGVWASLGNHDAGDTFPQMLAFLEQSGIHLLDDENVCIKESLVLAGRRDASPIGGFDGAARQTLDVVLEGADLTLPVVVMDHNPTHVDSYGGEVDLVLCGHTHRGQIFPGELFTNRMFSVDYGYYRKDSMSPHVIVTSGAGAWGMPMRVGTDCEVVVIRLSGMNN